MRPFAPTADKDSVSFSQRVNAQDRPAVPPPDLQLEIAHLLLIDVVAYSKLSNDLQLEIAHILLIDVVGYSKLLVNEQIELLQELKRNRAKYGMFSRCRSKR